MNLVATPQYSPFRLDSVFLANYQNKKPPFGFNGLGELVYLRTYSRIKDDGTNEVWWETLRRVVEGTYRMQQQWITTYHLGWSATKAQRSAQEMYHRMFHMKFLPPGRGLWAMGSALTEDRGLWAALNNCAFVSTNNLKYDLADPFTFLMDASMLGIGVGFDTKGAGTLSIQQPQGSAAFIIPDTREGWVESVERLLLAYFTGAEFPIFNYNTIRAAGEPIKGFGGVASGAVPLMELHAQLVSILRRQIDQPLSTTNIVDIMNLIGKCVVAGNVRRTAEIAFGDPESSEYLDLKNYEINPNRESYGWTSNNSVFAEIGMHYEPACKRIVDNGEPGFAWLDNMRAYGRMKDAPNHRDHLVLGGNPCLEQSLESYELCCLCETFPANHDSLDDFKRTLKFAYLYAKTVTLGKTPWTRTNRVMLRNRRIGLSQSGIVQAIAKLGLDTYRQWCEEGYQTVQYYDQVYSGWLAVPRSIKTTSIKPSGTVSILAGATPGLHFPEAFTYIRRIRLSRHSELVEPLRRAGYPLEPAYGAETTTLVVEVPVRITDDIRLVADVSMWEQLQLAAFMQYHWADNQVSCTVSFDPETEGTQLAAALDYFQYHLKGISFLPRRPMTYRQMPYEAISDSEYQERVHRIKQPLQLAVIHHEEAELERFCTTDTCEAIAH